MAEQTELLRKDQKMGSENASAPLSRVQLAANLTILASQEGRSWVHRAALFATPLSSDYLPPGSSQECTKALMNTALFEGKRTQERPGNKQDVQMTLTRTVWNLICAYQTTHTTPKVLEIAAKRFKEMGRKKEEEHCLHELEDEIGHDLIVLKDLSALGLPAEDLLSKVIPPTKALAELAHRLVDSDKPAAIFGYAYALEKICTFIGREYIDSIRAVTPAGVEACRTFIIHSSVGAEARHVDEMIEFVSELAPQERLVVIKAVYETALVHASMPLFYSDEEINAFFMESGVDLPALLRS